MGRPCKTSRRSALDGGSQQNVLRCLRVLFDHGYLDRPRSQLAHLPLTGPRPMVYGLGSKGGAALRDYGEAKERRNWSERNKRAGAIFIEHTLAIADCMVGLEVACRRDKGIQLLHESDILARAPEQTRIAPEPLRISVPGLDRRLGITSVIPDGLFGLTFPDETAAYFLLEVDRGSMPVARSRTHMTSFKRKLAVYWEAWKQRRFGEQFGIDRMRVLTVTSSTKRVQHMLDVVSAVTGGKRCNFFLFATMDDVTVASPLHVTWTSSTRERIKLLG